MSYFCLSSERRHSNMFPTTLTSIYSRRTYHSSHLHHSIQPLCARWIQWRTQEADSNMKKYWTCLMYHWC